MNTPDSLNTENKNLFNLILKNWEELDDSLKTKLIKIWRVLTYKWQLQILFNLPFKDSKSLITFIGLVPVFKAREAAT